MAKKKVYKELNEEELLDSLKTQVKTNYKVQIKCKNKKQKEFLHRLKDPNKIICFGIGSAGTGKSYISLAYALQALQDKDSLFDKIIIITPTCEAGAMTLGYLKGSIDDKMHPYIEADKYTMSKILDNSNNYLKGKDIIEYLVQNDKINFELVNFARGKSFDNALILIAEAENFNKQEMLLLLTRIGENSKIVISGDIEQLDRKDIKRTNEECGIEYAINKLQDMEETSVTIFTNDDIVRNPIISKIINKWKE